MLGFGGVIITLAASVATLQNLPEMRWLLVVLLAGAVLLFGAVVWMSARGWAPRRWESAPEPEQLWEDYATAGSQEVRRYLISYKLESYKKNKEPLEAKRKYIQSAQWLLLLEVVYVLLILATLPYLP